MKPAKKGEEMVLIALPEGMVRGMKRIIVDRPDLAFEDLGDLVASAIRTYTPYFSYAVSGMSD
jgi:hypothetical protein